MSEGPVLWRAVLKCNANVPIVTYASALKKRQAARVVWYSVAKRLQEAKTLHSKACTMWCSMLSWLLQGWNNINNTNATYESPPAINAPTKHEWTWAAIGDTMYPTSANEAAAKGNPTPLRNKMANKSPPKKSFNAEPLKPCWRKKP